MDWQVYGIIVKVNKVMHIKLVRPLKLATTW